MNRREALQVLVSMPAVERIAHATVQPSSVIVCECPGAVSRETAERITASLRQLWPEPQRIMILTEGMTLRVIDE